MTGYFDFVEFAKPYIAVVTLATLAIDSIVTSYIKKKCADCNVRLYKINIEYGFVNTALLKVFLAAASLWSLDSLSLGQGGRLTCFLTFITIEWYYFFDFYRYIKNEKGNLN